MGIIKTTCFDTALNQMCLAGLKEKKMYILVVKVADLWGAALW